MIRQIRGPVLATTPNGAVVEVGGFGVEVHMSAPGNLKLGVEVVLATHLAVKQDGMELYGFADTLDRDFFELVLTVPGVGPKTALAVLRKAPRATITGAIQKRDISYLTKVAGLGKKIAEKMLVELADKIGDTPHDESDTEVFDTLVALGYTEREARRAIQTIPESVSGKDARLKAALSGNQ